MTDMRSAWRESGSMQQGSGKHLRPFGTRLDEQLIHQVKVASAVTTITVQEIVDEALRSWLEVHAL